MELKALNAEMDRSMAGVALEFEIKMAIAAAPAQQFLAEICFDACAVDWYGQRVPSKWALIEDRADMVTLKKALGGIMSHDPTTLCDTHDV